MVFYLVLSLFLVLVGHAFRLLRWEQFIRIYERPLRGQMLRGMAGGYALNFVLPFHLGDVFRAVFTGRRMKSGIGFALATVIMDRFLDVWFVALGFGTFWALGQGGAAVLGAAQYYLVFSLVLALVLVLGLLPGPVMAAWPSFRGNGSNMGITDVQTPAPDYAKLQWAAKIGTSAESMTTSTAGRGG